MFSKLFSAVPPEIRLIPDLQGTITSEIFFFQKSLQIMILQDLFLTIHANLPFPNLYLIKKY